MIESMLARDEKASQPSQNGTQGDNDPPTGNAHLVTIAERIVYAIADTGCSVVYGGHGAAIAPLVNAVVKHPKVKWVCARNEHDAATMAAAHAKLTGQLGCVIATSGPGATNLTTGLMESAQDRVPVLAITGMKPSSQIGYAEFQDTNQAQLFSGAGLIWSKTVTSAGAVSYTSSNYRYGFLYIRL